MPPLLRNISDITADVVVRHYMKNDWELGAHIGYRRVAAYNKRYEWNDEFFTGSNGENGFIFTGWDESKDQSVHRRRRAGEDNWDRPPQHEAG